MYLGVPRQPCGFDISFPTPGQCPSLELGIPSTWTNTGHLEWMEIAAFAHCSHKLTHTHAVLQLQVHHYRVHIIWYTLYGTPNDHALLSANTHHRHP